MSQDDLIDKTDNIISELVYDKVKLQKAYNYYNGRRDKKQYQYLEENFGIGSPTSVQFTPLLRKHIDELVGEFLDIPILPKISCKDKDTISNIGREKQLEISNQVINFLKSHLNNSLLKLSQGQDITDKTIKEQLDKIVENINESFISQYEIAAQNVVKYIMQSKQTDLMTKLRQLLIDILVTGYCFYRVVPSINNNNINIEVLDPRNVFVDRNPDSPYIKDSYKVVVRSWLTKSQILAKYGKELSKDDIKNLKDDWQDHSLSTYHRSSSPVISIYEDMDDQDDDIIPGRPHDDRGHLIPVYEVEWIETDDDFIMQRYQTIRINDEFYILRGKDTEVVRSQSNPTYCGLTVNGVVFLNRGKEPYSLILKCASLQDRYDLLQYYRDVIMANSGVKGSIIDISMIPKSLGVKFPERVQRWLAYKKQGLELIDTTMEGRAEGQPINTIFNGYDDSIPAAAIQAIEVAIQSVENTVCSITGVFRERLNGIQQRDAVSNIQQGVTNSFTVTKPYFHQMDLVVNEILLDSLNEAKIVWKEGLVGTLILGESQQKLFTALPQYFTVTDYDIEIVPTTEIMQDIQTIKQLIPEFIKSGQVSADIIFEAITSKSLSQLKTMVRKAIAKQKAENNQIQQLSQKLEESQQQNQQLQQQLKQASQQLQKLNEQKMQLDQRKIQLEYQVDWFKAQTDKAYKDRSLDLQEERTKLEIAQLHDGNPYNDKIRQA